MPQHPSLTVTASQMVPDTCSAGFCGHTWNNLRNLVDSNTCSPTLYCSSRQISILTHALLCTEQRVTGTAHSSTHPPNKRGSKGVTTFTGVLGWSPWFRKNSVLPVALSMCHSQQSHSKASSHPSHPDLPFELVGYCLQQSLHWLFFWLQYVLHESITLGCMQWISSYLETLFAGMTANTVCKDDRQGISLALGQGMCSLF